MLGLAIMAPFGLIGAWLIWLSYQAYLEACEIEERSRKRLAKIVRGDNP